MSSLDLGAKPLILRAASGFEPVLVIPQSDAPPLSTQAALVLEGLTVVNQPSSNLSFDRIGQPVGTGISVARAPFLAAHCRFAMESDSALPKVPPPECVRLLNVPTAQFLNCEFVTRRGFASSWTAIPTSAGTLATNTLIVRGSTFHGNFVSKAGRAEACSQLALHGNTFCGETLVMLAGGAPSLPIQAEATDNVFALDNMVLLLPRRTESCTVERLVRWNGSSNAYAVETAYVSCDPQVATHEEWEGSDATVTLAAVSTDLGLKARVENLTNYTRVAEDAAFAITPEEQQRLPANLGADAEHNGPGKSYDDWRASPAYHDWQKLVREHLPEVAADN